MVGEGNPQCGEPLVEHCDGVTVEGQLVLSVQERAQLDGWEVGGGLWRGGEGSRGEKGGEGSRGEGGEGSRERGGEQRGGKE